jgi:hypothetical protein
MYCRSRFEFLDLARSPQSFCDLYRIQGVQKSLYDGLEIVSVNSKRYVLVVIGLQYETNGSSVTLDARNADLIYLVIRHVMRYVARLYSVDAFSGINPFCRNSVLVL